MRAPLRYVNWIIARKANPYEISCWKSNKLYILNNFEIQVGWNKEIDC
jgi:hypothetical protein